jgi:hypothetical protein
MTAKHFVIGERVRLRITTPFARVGTLGTIRRVFAFMPDLYDVQFDGLIGPRLIFGREMEHATSVLRVTVLP